MIIRVVLLDYVYFILEKICQKHQKYVHLEWKYLRMIENSKGTEMLM